MEKGPMYRHTFICGQAFSIYEECVVRSLKLLQLAKGQPVIGENRSMNFPCASFCLSKIQDPA